MGKAVFMESKINFISLPDSLEVIPSWAFKNTPLQELTIPKNLITIEEAAFIECKNLSFFASKSRNFVIHNGVVYNRELTIMHLYPSNSSSEILPTCIKISSACGFSGCSFTNYTLKVALKYVDDYLFRSNRNLEFVDLTCGVFKSLGYTTFGWCTNLREVRLPPTLKSLGDQVFFSTPNLLKIIVPSSFISAGTGFVSSSIIDIHFCGVNPVSYTTGLSSFVRVHVTSSYKSTSFMNVPITDKNAQCNVDTCPFKYSEPICPTEYVSDFYNNIIFRTAFQVFIFIDTD